MAAFDRETYQIKENVIRKSRRLKTGLLLPKDAQKSFKRLVGARTKKSRRFLIRNALLLVNAAIVLVIGIYIYVDQRQASEPAAVSNSTFLARPSASSAAALDTLSSADIAVAIARTARLTESTAVTNQADSFSAQLALAPTDEKIVSKPQLVSTNQKTRKDIQKYTVAQGETVGAIATKFGVTSDSIKWSNGLTSDSVAAGKELVIPPRNGIVYEVKSGDNVDALATKYKANKEQIIAFNDIEISGLPVGEKILIPDGVVVVPVATRVTPAQASTGVAYGFAASFNFTPGFNGYDYGYCTWYVANKRISSGKALPTNLGNASTWKARAQGAGMAVGSTPAPGAVAWKYPRDYYGHVAYVESVNADGSFIITEMNVAGWNRVSSQTVSAAGASGYMFIY